MFITMALSWAKDNWKLVAIALAAFALYSYISVLKYTISSQDEKIVGLQSQLQTCQDNTVKLTESLKAVNDSLNTISSTMKDTSNQFKDLNNTMVTATKQLKGKMDQFLANDVKPIDCNATIQYLIDAKRDYSK